MRKIISNAGIRRLKRNNSLGLAVNNLWQYMRRPRAGDYRKIMTNALRNINNKITPKKVVLPKYAMLGVTNICNLNCLMCQTNSSKRQKGYMKPEVFELLIKRLKDAGIDWLGISIQGEPFLHQQLEDMLAVAHKNQFSIWLSTNGHFPERMEPLYKRFPELITYYRFSIDGARKETYEHIRRGGSFEKVLEALDALHRINKGKRDSRVKACIDVATSMINMYELNEFFHLFKKYCFEDQIRFNLIDSVAPDTTHFWDNFPFKNLITKWSPCHRPFELMNFTYNGEMTLCCEDYTDELVVGDIRQQSIQDIWNSKRAELIRQKHMDPDSMDMVICKKCFKPHKFVQKTTNAYIHYLYCKHPDMGSKEFGGRVHSYLRDLNNAYKDKDVKVIEGICRKAFSV